MVVNVERLVVNRESDLVSEPNLQYWADRAIADGNIRAVVRQREQTIHVWCEGMPCPNAAQMTSAFPKRFIKIMTYRSLCRRCRESCCTVAAVIPDRRSSKSLNSALRQIGPSASKSNPTRSNRQRHQVPHLKPITT